MLRAALLLIFFLVYKKIFLKGREIVVFNVGNNHVFQGGWHKGVQL
jgi:hypothetical protein